MKTITTIEGKEITLPYYTKGGPYFYKVVNEESCLIVCDFTHHSNLLHSEIGLKHVGLAFDGRNTVSDEVEFNEAFNRVSDHLRGMTEESIKLN
jgi:hypothetical protein